MDAEINDLKGFERVLTIFTYDDEGNFKNDPAPWFDWINVEPDPSPDLPNRPFPDWDDDDDDALGGDASG